MICSVTMNGSPVLLRQADVFPPPYHKHRKMPFAVIPAGEKMHLEITVSQKIHSVTIRPLQLRQTCSFTEHTVSIDLNRPLKFSLEINGRWQDAVLFFIQAPRDLPDPADDNLIYFPAGEHMADVLTIRKDNVTLCLAEGALVHGKLTAENCKNLTVCGSGILSSEKFPRYDGIHNLCVEISHCRNVEIRDITVLDSAGWSVRILDCDQVHIDGINILGSRPNSDGVDICGSRDVLVENCFIRNWDDGFVVKAFNTGNLENITFRNSVLWNDFARPMEVGVEIQAEEARNIRFHNIDVIHSLTGYPIMGIHHGDRARIRDVEFSDIRIEDAPGAQLFDLRITDSVWNHDSRKGDIQNVLFRNIYLAPQPVLPSRSRLQGFGPACEIRNVTLDNICFGGKAAADLNGCHLEVKDFALMPVLRHPEGVPLLEAVSARLTISSPFLPAADGFYEGAVTVQLTNPNRAPVQGEMTLQVSPVHTAPVFPMSYSLAPGVSAEQVFPLRLQPGSYVIRTESRDPALQPDWKYIRLPLIPAPDLDSAPAYTIVNCYGDRLEDVRLALQSRTVLLRSEALRDNTFDIYTAEPAEPAPGEVLFTAEETDFGYAMAVNFTPAGPEAAPQLRCPAEITYVFKNQPKVSIVKTTVGGQGRDTASLDLDTLGITGSRFWLEIAANLPETAGYRYPFTLFHSVRPDCLAHMFADVQLKP